MQTGNGTKTRENKIVIIIIVPLTDRHTLEIYSNNNAIHYLSYIFSAKTAYFNYAAQAISLIK